MLRPSRAFGLWILLRHTITSLALFLGDAGPPPPLRHEEARQHQTVAVPSPHAGNNIGSSLRDSHAYPRHFLSSSLIHHANESEPSFIEDHPPLTHNESLFNTRHRDVNLFFAAGQPRSLSLAHAQLPFDWCTYSPLQPAPAPAPAPAHRRISSERAFCKSLHSLILIDLAQGHGRRKRVI
ncbi:uncharacterized protein BT62DRAFT_331787 [Guyanagaster necrorhizus]|uniref:Secreted protein n=1 Tax=Guyanagaster necrorhizus TaxID=856835 RepID=A0A9P7VP62_9AGAR|nr:uncharacterized protein BT62DRAFT_331787 [Guyanagaster necrorhizus MCA 3950]KAG7443444.1 hypothetical protein BT62DRAFT_331787 [Guyanagaster necrorhizus MCA 3950]